MRGWRRPLRGAAGVSGCGRRLARRSSSPCPIPRLPTRSGRCKQRTAGLIAAYAMGRDYHDVVKGRLKQLAGWLAQRAGASVKCLSIPRH